MRHRAAILLVLLALCCWTPLLAAPPPAGTTITLVAWRLRTIGSWAQVVSWLDSRGCTIDSVSGAGPDMGRPPGVTWTRAGGQITRSVTITLNETLTGQQKTDLRDAILAATSGVSVQ